MSYEAEPLLLEIKDSIDRLIQDRRSDRLSHLMGQALLSLVVLSMAVIGVAVVVAEDADRAALETKLCNEVLTTRHILIDAYERAIEATEINQAGLEPEAKAAQIVRLEASLEQLRKSQCLPENSLPEEL